jgi:hypothetical protein
VPLLAGDDPSWTFDRRFQRPARWWW